MAIKIQVIKIIANLTDNNWLDYSKFSEIENPRLIFLDKIFNQIIIIQELVVEKSLRKETPKMQKTAIKTLILIGLAIFLLSNCSWNAKTVKPFIGNPDFQKENLPVRTLLLAIVTDESYSNEQILKRIKESSDLMEIQTGIKLEVTNIARVIWKNKKIDDMRDILKTAAEKWTFAFDIAVGLTAFPESKTDSTMGSTDTATYRFIIIGSLQSNILAHEIFHAIAMSARHSNGGIMKSWSLETAPNEPIRDEDYYLLPEDRETILKNKWRNF